MRSWWARYHLCVSHSRRREESRCARRVAGVCLCASTPLRFISCSMSFIHAPVHQDESTFHAARTIKPLTLAVLGPDSCPFFCTSCVLCCLVNRQIKRLRFHRPFLDSGVCCLFCQLLQTASDPLNALIKERLLWFLGIHKVFFVCF